ncbi:deoxyuridine 5'-triphosphate nucleotidohydrolase Dut [Candidatus Omnitrophus magneticus]|uniref:Deoxyuridine 5'-triphosphate nucleotidohydrolase n=1 Tax=Candidatus Omnitrophus magneticus TaxID=1609969 RepID=A0A0F0CL94_9BACT|nr:deoxyuridine 5'-triphosphate nucleotidohydrolase Dut [Candidatus Omnitrophus magneticus]
MKSIKLKIKKKETINDLPLPSYATNGSSGMDLLADVDSELVINPGEIKLISCGIYIELPLGYEAEIRPRSGLALKHGITLVNTPGTIDSDYRGLISLIVINMGNQPYVVKRGQRLAQMIIKEVIRAELEVVEELGDTVRAHGGFGHTGV